MKKRFLLDTNVLLYDPQAMFRFENNEVVICLTVIQELDKFKRRLDETGRNAREVVRHLDEIRERGLLTEGIEIEKGSVLRVDLCLEEEKGSLAPELQGDSHTDAILLATARRYQKDEERPVILVTKDANLRVRADALGIVVEDYEPQSVDIEDLYSGTRILDVPGEVVDRFFAERKLELSPQLYSFYPNEFLILKDNANESHTALARFHADKGLLLPLAKKKEGVWGITPKNVEQNFALDLLLDDSVQLVSLIGKAGTGKTLLALAVGLSKTIDEGRYHKLLVSRPVFPMGKDIGYLPGDLEEKLNPWMQPIFDNVEFLLGGTGKEYYKRASGGYKDLVNQGMLNIEPLTYIRGRSIPNQYLIVDEAQNLSPHEIKTIMTRVGENTKIVLTGDCYQIDNPYIDSANNGLTYVVERFKEEGIAGHVTLTKGERSQLSELATKLL
ncbi:MAG: PhoH family protein [Deltaproteobacteria bacterium]|nr:PhoH family protein [Deltaproteobacteria bacterium]